MNSFYIFIQARIRSTRLPGKIFTNFFGESVLDRIIRSSKKILKKENIFLVTGNKSDPSILEGIAKKHGINFYSGSEKNVLKRFCDTIKAYNIINSNIIRITADNYLVQPIIIKKEIKYFKKNNLKYIHIKPLSHFGAEIVNSDLLLKQLKNKPSKNSKEHVTWDIRKKSKTIKFGLASNFGGVNHKKRLTLDTIYDLELLKKIEKNYPGLIKLNCVKEIKKLPIKLYK
jgi:spore coat polysaccharide biosynthesis protein SpsF